MHSRLRIVVVLYVSNFVPEYKVGWSESQQTTRIAEKLNLNASHFMQGRTRDRGDVKVNASQEVGFKCVHCVGEFGSRMVMDTHHRHCSSMGTPSANPMSYSRYRSLHVQTCLLGSFANTMPLPLVSPCTHVATVAFAVVPAGDTGTIPHSQRNFFPGAPPATASRMQAMDAGCGLSTRGLLGGPVVCNKW